MKKIFTVVICLLLVACVQSYISDNNKSVTKMSVSATADQAASVITGKMLHDYVARISSDEFEGRAPALP